MNLFALRVVLGGASGDIRKCCTYDKQIDEPLLKKSHSILILNLSIHFNEIIINLYKITNFKIKLSNTDLHISFFQQKMDDYSKVVS
jgi:hypothetical protein